MFLFQDDLHPYEIFNFDAEGHSVPPILFLSYVLGFKLIN